jgi:hypothetical protein
MVQDLPDNSLDKLCQDVYGAYEYLRDHDLAAQSGTSKRLRSGDIGKLRSRLLEELYELYGVVEGTHFHEGFDSDLILEGYEVLYWAFSLAIAQQISYTDITPGLQLQQGFQAGVLSRSELLPHFTPVIETVAATQLALGATELSQVAYLVGQACALNQTSPARLLERDRHEMSQKAYLNEYWASR